MNNFEKRKILDYLIKLLPVTDTNDYSFDDVFDFLCLEFNINRKPYPIDNDNCLEVNTPKQQDHFAKLFMKDKSVSCVRGVYFISVMSSTRKGTKLMIIKSADSAAKALTLSFLVLSAMVAIDDMSFISFSFRLGLWYP